jgi:hypothetical protein
MPDDHHRRNFLPGKHLQMRNPSGSILGVHVYHNQDNMQMLIWRDEYGTANRYRPLSRTNYMGVAGCGLGSNPKFQPFEGIYTNRSQISLAAGIADGSSNTLLYGETCGTFSLAGEKSMDINWMAGGGMGTHLGLQKGTRAMVGSFSSAHVGGVQFCFADNSVRMLRFGKTRWNGSPRQATTPDWLVLQQLAGRADGAVVDPNAL